MYRLWDGIKQVMGEIVAYIKDQIMGAVNAINPLNWFGGGDNSEASAPSTDGARAKGGPVSANRTYLVGEHGPELYTPDRNGSIVPNNETMDILRRSSNDLASQSRSQPSTVPAQQMPMEQKTINVGPFNIYDASDPSKIADLVISKLNDVLRQEERTAHAD